MPTAKELSSLGYSDSSIKVEWVPAFDPDKTISGYELTWKILEDDKGQHVINSPLQSSGVLPVNTKRYEIKNLGTYVRNGRHEVFMTIIYENKSSSYIQKYNVHTILENQRGSLFYQTYVISF